MGYWKPHSRLPSALDPQAGLELLQITREGHVWEGLPSLSKRGPFLNHAIFQVMGTSISHALCPQGLAGSPHAVPSSSWARLFQVIAANKISPLRPAHPETLPAGEGLGPQALSLPLRPTS